MDVVAPAPSGANTSEPPRGLRLEWREVWWARSFGLPPINSALKWTRLFFLRGVLRIFFTRRFRISVPQRGRSSATAGSSQGLLPVIGRWVRRAALEIVLFVYDLLQALWKSVQWLLGIPLVYGVLAIGNVLRRLSSFPGFDVLARIAPVLLDPTSLRWVASTQLYLQDYTRADSIRRRFERELGRLLDDPRCQRIVVIAHSIGTVMAYEGLTSTLPREQAKGNHKPVTFVCLAQMLGRVWPLARTDPHRVRGVLPDSVRWLHFWARFDPVVPGSLTARSLPLARDWPIDGEPNPDEAIRASLARCKNATVVNVDSFLHDHDHQSYWDNLEQVVGPIARELVEGHAELAQLVDEHLATADEVLVRRWQVASRASGALIGGAAIGLSTLLLELAYGMGPATRQVVGDLLALGLKLPLFLGLLWQLAADLLARLGEQVHHLALQIVGAGLSATVAHLAAQATDWGIDLGIAVVITALVVERLAQALAPAGPFALRTPRQRPTRN